MAAKIIVSYDDTENDRDALALGRLFAGAGANVALAYVRHAKNAEHEGEALEERDAQALLERGAQSFGDRDIERHVVVHASTGEGLRALALREGADVVVFGSDYRTAAGHVRANPSAQRLLDGGPVAVAIAPANLRSREVAIEKIGVLSDHDDPSARTTAEGLAERLDATISAAPEIALDMLVVGSRPEAQQARVMLSATAEYAIETATCPVLVVPRGHALEFAERPLVTV
jgi:nucleotide-binding universal stress UspA family protein